MAENDNGILSNSRSVRFSLFGNESPLRLLPFLGDNYLEITLSGTSGQQGVGCSFFILSNFLKRGPAETLLVTITCKNERLMKSA